VGKTTTRCQNEYRIIDDSTMELHVFGGKYEVKVIFDKEDFKTISSVHWGAMGIGRDKKPYPYTQKNKKSILLPKWLLNVKKNSGLKVEHRDRNQLNCKRDNIYIVHNKSMRNRKALNDGLYIGVHKVVQHNGNHTGYNVSYVDTGKKKVKYFSNIEFEGAEAALQAAIKFRDSLMTNLT